MICKLFIVYKLTSKGFSQDLAKLYEELLAPYATQYIELISVVTDLNFYAPLIGEDQKNGIVASLKKELEKKAQNPNKIRHASAEISVAKFEFMFRNEAPKTIDELIQITGPLLERYHEYLKIDEKPEKGDRKMADEMVLLIADVIDSYLSKPDNVD